MYLDLVFKFFYVNKWILLNLILIIIFYLFFKYGLVYVYFFMKINNIGIISLFVL